MNHPRLQLSCYAQISFVNVAVCQVLRSGLQKSCQSIYATTLGLLFVGFTVDNRRIKGRVARFLPFRALAFRSARNICRT